MKLDWALALEIAPDLLRGLLVTLCIMPPCAVLGVLVAVPVAIGMNAPAPVIRLPAVGFSVFFRSAPALVVLYMIYNGLPQLGLVRDTPLWNVFRNPLPCAILALALNHAGFASEIFRGGIAAVPKEYLEAASALSLPRHIVYRKIVLPVALRLALSAYRNEFVFLVKATSIVGAITVVDLLAAANEIVESTYDPLTPLVAAAGLYWIVINAAQLGFDCIERHLDRYVSRAK